ncbi:hypothetical protein [Brucella intermedia]|uniref:hypothetical protein n=1 Tax=Brucella intermedia TaxID=94625 RepID=UPI002361A1ED|nr:hypothetical protein [Brucella intermedia]
MKSLKKIVIAAVLTVSVHSAVGAQESAYWVVVGSIQDAGLSPRREQIIKSTRRCGFRVFNDFSDKFAGFRGGLNVFVIDIAFPTRLSAQKALNRVKKCIPDAYIKFGSYAGE